MLSVVLISALLAFTHAKDAGKCYGLALQGGGDKGAYQAGALDYIVEHLDSPQAQYDVVTGVSVGSLNGAFLAGFAKGDEKKSTEQMLKAWQELSQENIYKNWKWGGVVRGLLYEDALYDSSPFREYIKKDLQPPKRHFYVSATDAGTGAEMTWDETTDFQTLLKAIDASSSFPGFFSPVDDLGDGRTYYDGGVSFNVNIHSAVLKCRDLGFDDKDIVIDVLLCSGATFTDKDVSKYKSIPMVMRFYEIERFYDTMELVERAMEDYYAVNFRYVVAPTTKLESSIVPMSFKHADILHMIEQGKKDAQQVMEMGHTAGAKYLVEYTHLKRSEGYTEDYGVFLQKKLAAKENIMNVIE